MPWMRRDDHEPDGDPFRARAVRPGRDHDARRQDRRARRGPHRRHAGGAPGLSRRRPGERLLRRTRAANAPSTPFSASKRAASSSIPTSTPARPRPTCRPATLLMEAMRRVDEISHLRDALPSYARVAYSAGASQDAVEATVLGHLGPGQRSVGDIVDGACTTASPTSTTCCRRSPACASAASCVCSTERRVPTSARRGTSQREVEGCSCVL